MMSLFAQFSSEENFIGNSRKVEGIFFAPFLLFFTKKNVENKDYSS